MLKVDIASFTYSEKAILKQIAFSLQPGEHLSVLGESGCGKSTLLHLIYGLLHLDDGSIFYNHQQLLGPTQTLIPGEPFMKLVAQEFNIMSFTTVAENIGSHLSRQDQEKDNARISELLTVVDMTEYANTLVKNLSGGQKQRVALAKALANQPELLLLDEPFSNIDVFRKNKLRRKLFGYLKENNISCITATHDNEEALAFSDRILMLKNGEVETLATPENVYKNVSNVYQAGFFGEVNSLPATLLTAEKLSEELILFPHQLRVSDKKTKLQVIVIKTYFKGSHFLIESEWQGKKVFFEHFEKLQARTSVFLSKK